MIPQIIFSALIILNLLVSVHKTQREFIANFIGQAITFTLLFYGGFFHCWGIG